MKARIVAILLLIAPSCSFADISLKNYEVVPLKYGVNSIDFSTGQSGMFTQSGFVILAYYSGISGDSIERDIASIYINWDNKRNTELRNFNAVTIDRNPSTGDNFLLTAESTRDSSNATYCVTHTFRLLKPKHDLNNSFQYPMALVLGSRDNSNQASQVTFEIYTILVNEARDTWNFTFQISETITSKEKYCDVDDALFREFGLPKYIKPSQKK